MQKSKVKFNAKHIKTIENDIQSQEHNKNQNARTSRARKVARNPFKAKHLCTTFLIKSLKTI